MTNILLASRNPDFWENIDWNTAYTIVVLALIAVMIIGMIIQWRLRSVFKRYKSIHASCGKTASDVAREILYKNNCDADVIQIPGELSDNYNPKTNTVSLSQGVYSSSSVSALAVAIHEIGHVMQHKTDYVPIKIRNAILPVAQIGSYAAPFIVLIGILMSAFNLAMTGAILYAAILGFQLVTLPVEFNASSRAIHMLEAGGYLTRDEIPGARRVLRMAAMTYVISTLATLISLLRILLLVMGTRRRD